MPLPWIVAGAATLITAGTALWAWDEANEREQEQDRYRSEIADLEGRLDETEREYRFLRDRLGQRNQQVRDLASQVQRLRRELTAARQRAA